MLRHPATSQWQPSAHLSGTVADARRLLAGVSNAVVLTGAGVSTDSGVPDYRGPNSMRATPMMYSEFVGHELARRRYWARNYQGWASMSTVEPNTAHRAIAKWEHAGKPCPMVGLITQNVDGLHETAGSRRLVTLHGRAADVRCLGCGRVSSRAALQHRLADANPGVQVKRFLEHAELRPDADAEVADWRDFRVPGCEVCGGILKPDVVFFGESVPKHRVAVATNWCAGADALLVAGSSLTVMSGLRFARSMAKQGKPVIIINHGATRADDLAAVRLDMAVGQALARLAAEV